MHTPSWHVHAFFGAVACFVLACATTPDRPEYPQVSLPESAWGQGYSYSANLALPESPETSEQITIAVVNPEYRVEDSVLRLDAYRPVGKGFSASMGVDIDKVLISKGMTTKGPFPDLQEITYSDKKDSHLTLAPQVFISVNVKPVGGRALSDGTTSQPGQPVLMGEYEPGKVWFVKDYEVTVRGWFVFAMHEPMSSEKMWVKRIELEDYTAPAMECFDGDEQKYYNQESGAWVHAGWACSNRLLLDFKRDVVADAFKKHYPILLQKLLTYIDIEELKELKKKTAEIRELKRY